VLWCDGEDLTNKPIVGRRRVLERIVKPKVYIQLGTYIEGEGRALFDLIKQKGMEGIIAKRKASICRPWTRASDWLKIKARLQQEFVVGGFTEGKGSRQRLGALLLGAFRNGKLHYFGHSGSGFSEKGIDEALHRMKPLYR
jgi:bifunctional non-homologous end joining protein LigD